MGSSAPVPGLLWVNSCVLRPDLIDGRSFEKFYDDVHIPEVRRPPGGPTIALRYKSLDPKANVDTFEANKDVTMPHLAFYKLDDINWMASEHFASVAHEHPTLPVETNHQMWGTFDASLRTYEVVARTARQPGTDRPKFIVTAETPSANEERFRVMEKRYDDLNGFRGSILYNLVTGIAEHEQKELESNGYIVSWFDEMPKLPENGPKHGQHIWELRRAHANEGATW